MCRSQPLLEFGCDLCAHLDQIATLPTFSKYGLKRKCHTSNQIVNQRDIGGLRIASGWKCYNFENGYRGRRERN